MKIANPYEAKSLFLPGYRKPGFKYQSTKSIIVPGGANNPSTFIVGGLVWQYTSDLECNLMINGPGGLNSGSLVANTVYYLYALVSNDQIKLLADINSPLVGPNGYSLWSYLGAFRTETSANVVAFTSMNGSFFITQGIDADFTATLAAATAQTLKAPVTASAAWIRGIWTAVNAIGDFFALGSSATLTTTQERATSATAASNSVMWLWCSLISAPTIYTEMSSNSDDVAVSTMGWMEDPSEFI